MEEVLQTVVSSLSCERVILWCSTSQACQPTVCLPCNRPPMVVIVTKRRGENALCPNRKYIYSRGLQASSGQLASKAYTRDYVHALLTVGLTTPDDPQPSKDLQWSGFAPNSAELLKLFEARCPSGCPKRSVHLTLNNTT